MLALMSLLMLRLSLQLNLRMELRMKLLSTFDLDVVVFFANGFHSPVHWLNLDCGTSGLSECPYCCRFCSRSLWINRFVTKWCHPYACTQILFKVVWNLTFSKSLDRDIDSKEKVSAFSSVFSMMRAVMSVCLAFFIELRCMHRVYIIDKLIQNVIQSL